MRFAAETEVDALAVAIGTSHGAYKFKGEPHLDFERLREITTRVAQPIVLHGASSLPHDAVELATRYGAQLPHAQGIPQGLPPCRSRHTAGGRARLCSPPPTHVVALALLGIIIALGTATAQPPTPTARSNASEVARTLAELRANISASSEVVAGYCRRFLKELEAA